VPWTAPLQPHGSGLALSISRLPGRTRNCRCALTPQTGEDASDPLVCADFRPSSRGRILRPRGRETGARRWDWRGRSRRDEGGFGRDQKEGGGVFPAPGRRIGARRARIREPALPSQPKWPSDALARFTDAPVRAANAGKPGTQRAFSVNPGRATGGKTPTPVSRPAASPAASRGLSQPAETYTVFLPRALAPQPDIQWSKDLAQQ
jgi:hypothetical protein